MSEHHARAGQEPSESSDLWAGAEVNFRYTRAQALADGVLIAVPAALVTEAGFRWPIALTAAAWADAVAWNEHTEARKPSPTGQDETGRLWDVLTMARHAIRAATSPATEAVVQVLRVPPTGRAVRPELTTLHLVAGPGDDGRPVLILMLPGED
jgi:hypothetical protein